MPIPNTLGILFQDETERGPRGGAGPGGLLCGVYEGPQKGWRTSGYRHLPPKELPGLGIQALNWGDIRNSKAGRAPVLVLLIGTVSHLSSFSTGLSLGPGLALLVLNK